MTRQIACYGILGMVALAGCARDPQAPTPVAPPTTPAAPAASWTPGSYSMTLDIGPECAVVPAGDRSRRYTVTIEGNLATLTGSTFLSGPICTGGTGLYAGVGCDQFFVPTNGENAWLSLAISDDDGHGGHVTEQTASGRWIEIVGVATARAIPSGIVAAGPGSVWYCPTASPYPFPCPDSVRCEARLEMTLSRR